VPFFDLHKAAQNFLHPSGRRARPLEQADPSVECDIAELPLHKSSLQDQEHYICLPGSIIIYESSLSRVFVVKKKSLRAHEFGSCGHAGRKTG
jgi:hypothetical protein